MAFGWKDTKPGGRTLSVLSQIFGILLGFLVSFAVGATVSTVYSSVMLVILIAPVVGGVTAGCFSRGNLLMGAFNGFGVGAITAVAILVTTWLLVTDAPATGGGAGLGIVLILLIAVVVAVVWIGLAVIGGIAGAAASNLFENYWAEQSGERIQ